MSVVRTLLFACAMWNTSAMPVKNDSSPPSALNEANRSVYEASSATMENLLEQSVTLFNKRYRSPEGLYFDKLYVTGGGWNPGSTAASGFGLITLCIANELKMITYAEALAQALTTLDKMQMVGRSSNGFLLHWFDVKSGSPDGVEEFSTIDTALYVLGALFTSNYLLEKAPRGQQQAAREFANQVNQLAASVQWTDVLIEDLGGAPGMYLKMSAGGVGVGVTRIFNEYYLLAA